MSVCEGEVNPLPRSLVDWKGYGCEDRSWEPERNITRGAIADFYKAFPDAIRSSSLIPLAHVFSSSSGRPVLQDEGPKGGG